MRVHNMITIRVTQWTGTGSFGRVRLVKNIENNTFHALKIMKKAKIVRLQQVMLPMNAMMMCMSYSSATAGTCEE